MNKKVIITGLSIAALGLAHGAFWFYQSSKIKPSIEQIASQVSKEIGRKNSELFYASSEVSGYPFNFTVKINQPKFISTGNGEKFEVTTGQEPISVISNLMGTSYMIKLPSKMSIKSSTEEKEKNYVLEFIKSAPEIAFSFSGNILLSAKDSTNILNLINDNLRRLTYNDSGYVLQSVEDSLKLASADSNYIQIDKTKGKPNIISTSYTIKSQNVDHSALFSGNINQSPAVQANLWPINANFEVTSIDTRDESGKSTSINFIVKNIDIASSSFGLITKGDIKANGEDIFPFGDLSIKIKDYKNMVDYFSDIVSTAFAESNIPLFHIKSEKSIDFKRVLYEVASEKSNDEKDLLLTLSREKGKSLFIGQKGLMEVIDLLKASATSDPRNDAAAPHIPPVDASPSAGTVSPKANR